MRYPPATIVKLGNARHEPGCKWFDDDGWNSGTLANYVRTYNDYPACTCHVVKDLMKKKKKAS